MDDAEKTIAKKSEMSKKITEIDKAGITNQQKENNEKKADTNYNLPEEKSHWERYKLYYLVFGTFFVTTLIILISNSTTNEEIGKINDRLDGKSSHFFNL